MTEKILLYVPKEAHGSRLDRFLTEYIKQLPPSSRKTITPTLSRTAVQKLIESGLVTINGVRAEKCGQIIDASTYIEITEQEPTKRLVSLKGFENFFDNAYVFEHEHFLIINKPSGILTHPTNQKNEQIAISDILISHYPSIAKVGEEERPGIVHRLDKYTSGLLILAKTDYGYKKLRELFAQRAIKKTYIALVEGSLSKNGLIVNAIMRDPLDPCRMTCCATSAGKPAQTSFELISYYKDYSLVKAFPITGRTHQIRVHFSCIGHPLAGDTLYGAKKNSALDTYLLHASELSFDFDGVPYQFTADLPQDFKKYIAKLQGSL